MRQLSGAAPAAPARRRFARRPSTRRMPSTASRWATMAWRARRSERSPVIDAVLRAVRLDGSPERIGRTPLDHTGSLVLARRASTPPCRAVAWQA